MPPKKKIQSPVTVFYPYQLNLLFYPVVCYSINKFFDINNKSFSNFQLITICFINNNNNSNNHNEKKSSII